MGETVGLGHNVMQDKARQCTSGESLHLFQHFYPLRQSHGHHRMWWLLLSMRGEHLGISRLDIGHVDEEGNERLIVWMTDERT